MGQIRKVKKKQEGKNGGKKKKRVPILIMCTQLVGNTPWASTLHVVTLSQENPLVWEPPLQQNPRIIDSSPPFIKSAF